MSPQRILVVGGGHVGLYAALRLSRKLGRNDAEVTIVDPQPHMTYQPFLPEAAAGKHLAAPLGGAAATRAEEVSRAVRRGHQHRPRDASTATVMPITGPARDVAVRPHRGRARAACRGPCRSPGLRENAVGFKTIGEAIYLRNKVLDQLDVAATTADPEVRRRALTFVFVGGGYAGIEALAEMEDMARDALRYYPELVRDRHALGADRGVEADPAGGRARPRRLHGRSS